MTATCDYRHSQRGNFSLLPNTPVSDRETVLREMSAMEFKEKEHNYIESDREREEGHQDTRSRNFNCENKDPHLGCDPHIDVAG